MVYHYISTKIICFLISQEIIKEEEEEEVLFGCNRILCCVGTVLFLFLTAILTNSLPEAAIYFFCFYFTRKYAGGYHATTNFRCNSIYLFSYVGCLFIYRNLNLPTWLWIFLLLFGFLTILLFSPIDNPDNPILDGYEIVFYKWSIIIYLVESMTVIALAAMNFDIYRFAILAITTAVINMHIEQIKRGEYKMNNPAKKALERMAKMMKKSAAKSTREVSLLGSFQPKRPKSIKK